MKFLVAILLALVVISVSEQKAYYRDEDYRDSEYVLSPTYEDDVADPLSYDDYYAEESKADPRRISASIGNAAAAMSQMMNTLHQAMQQAQNQHNVQMQNALEKLMAKAKNQKRQSGINNIMRQAKNAMNKLRSGRRG